MREPRKPKADKRIDDILTEVRQASKPFWDDRQAVEERECPKRRALFSAAHISISTEGGNCPVQIEGAVKGKPFYFRARGDVWSLSIGGRDVISNPDWYHEEDYGTWPDAGWMHLHEAYDFLLKGVVLWRPKLAKAIEARRAETGTGSVHESAVGTADLPTS